MYVIKLYIIRKKL